MTTKYGYRDANARRVKQVQPPCTTCDNMAFCAAFEVACPDYVTHVRNGCSPRRDRHPTRANYDLAMSGAESA